VHHQITLSKPTKSRTDRATFLSQMTHRVRSLQKERLLINRTQSLRPRAGGALPKHVFRSHTSKPMEDVDPAIITRIVNQPLEKDFFPLDHQSKANHPTPTVLRFGDICDKCCLAGVTPSRTAKSHHPAARSVLDVSFSSSISHF
jgi:hypothetical protein